ncbi:MAG: acetyl-CoA carboxylase biotin carboxylase subunit [Alphaproteobacteria bacterium]|nr:acetyl-CoA carboxylase biotin carboxylase subunit [Alphaproteobacteria bacterium]
MIEKILIANRGEIACRVIKTCRRLGISTVAVYSDADAEALHVAMADAAVNIGPAPARESYLVMEKIIDAAKKTGADAIHPGYGFLAENEDFAKACAKAGLVFIGPPASAIAAMGGKSDAKALMEKAGVPLVPGYHGDKQDEKFLKAEAKKIGYPVLIKASAGGGGKGMRVVESEKDFAEALAGAKREAKAGFGDDHVLIEKYLASPRHVEIQVFADTKGNAVYLFERDCSIQRRHQKVLEEAPAPGLSEATRRKMGEAAVAAAKAIDYVGAGTVEFLLDAKENFYFMEMNTRLQVEHPVTELITQTDLVEEQIRVAEGETLSFTQDGLGIHGHAIEVRLYAEDPANNFLPGAGRIECLQFPRGADNVRVDTGVRESASGKDVISIHYDPMIAKIIAWGEDRAAAIANLKSALDETLVAGPKTNIVFLRRLLASEDFAAAKLSTGFIAAHEKELLPPKQPVEDIGFVLAALDLFIRREDRSFKGDMADWESPWRSLVNWRLEGHATDEYVFRDGDREVKVSVTPQGDYHAEPEVVMPDSRRTRVTVYSPAYVDMDFSVVIDGTAYTGVTLRDGARITLLRPGHNDEFTYLDPLGYDEAEEEGDGKLTAPMPGKVVAVRVDLGAAVKKGQPLVIVEAMKMEHTVIAPADGVVEAIHAAVGDQVHEKYELISIK